MLDGVVVYKELGRALAPSPHFVSSVMSAGVILAAGSDAQKDEWLTADQRGRGDHHAGVAGAARRLRARRRAAHGDRRRRRLAARRRQAPRVLRPRGGPPARARSHRDGPTFFLVDPSAAGDHTHAADVDLVGHAVPRRLRRRAGRRRRARRHRRRRVAGVGRGDARRHHPARRAGRRRCAVRARDHHAVRQGPLPVRQAARRVPVARALPVRRGHRGRRRRDAGVGGGVGRTTRGAT